MGNAYLKEPMKGHVNPREEHGQDREENKSLVSIIKTWAHYAMWTEEQGEH